MKNGKIYAIMIAIAFLVALVFSCVFLFSVSRVRTVYSVYSEKDVSEIQKSLDAFNGKNIFFVSENDIRSAVSDYTRFKVVSVDKSYPNVINVNIEERREVYRFSYEGVVYCMDETGFIIDTATEFSEDRDIIAIEFDGIEIISAKLGEVLETSEKGFFLSVLEMAKYANLTDCIKSVTFRDDKSVEIKEVVFQTYTGVKIIVDKPDVRGLDKMIKAFDVYDNVTVDYYKTFSQILVIEQATGEITATWENPKG